jgi:hypothetical protein
MSAETPDESIPQEPAIPGPKPPDEVRAESSPEERPSPDGSELPAEPEEPDQEGQRELGEPGASVTVPGTRNGRTVTTRFEPRGAALRRTRPDTRRSRPEP